VSAGSILGLDSSTPASAACVVRADGEIFEVGPDPAALEAAPAHAGELLPAIAEVMDAAGLDYRELEAIAVGVGPGTFTGLRIGLATARALAKASDLPLKPVSSLAALAAGIDAPVALPVIDAKRGEVFAALYEGGEPIWGPVAEAPERLAHHLREAAVTAVAAGDGSIRFREVLESAGIRVDPGKSRSHVVRALHVCRLAAEVPGRPPETVLPNYLRAPDAKPQ
jgi:tRNA threonylcarbamoyladenosine biosynthesis protein TsaB